MMNGAIAMDQPSGQQQMPSGRVPVERQSVPNGHVPAGQQKQPFVQISLLQPPPHVERLLQQQRGYVEEMFRQQHEVVQRQLAQIQQQQLEFMQRQAQILRSIVAAVAEQVPPHPEAHENAQMSRMVGNCSSAVEVRSEQQKSGNASLAMEMDADTASVGDRRKCVPTNNMSSAQVNLDTASVITEASTGARNIGCLMPSRSSTVAEAAVRMLLEEAGKFYYEMKVGGWTLVGLARVTREQLYGCGTIDGFGLSPLPNLDISPQGGNPSTIGVTLKVNMTNVDSSCSSCVDNKLAADMVPVFRSMDGPGSVKYRPHNEVLDRLKQYLPFSPVAIPERSPVVREEDERLQGKYISRRQYKPSSPGAKAVLRTSQQLIQPKLAGPWRSSGLLDDLEDPLAVKENDAGRSIIIVNMQVLESCLKEKGSDPNLQGVGQARPSEAILESIRTNLEFEPPPVPTSSALASETMKQDDCRDRMIAPHVVLSKLFSDNKWHWSTGLDCDGISIVVINVESNYRQIQPNDKPLSSAEWDPGPSPVSMPVVSQYLQLDLWNLVMSSAASGATTPMQLPVSLGQSSTVCAVDRPPALATSTTTSLLQSASTRRGRAPSVQVPCCSSLFRSSSQWSDPYLLY